MKRILTAAALLLVVAGEEGRELQRQIRRPGGHPAQGPEPARDNLQHLRRPRHEPRECGRPGRDRRGDTDPPKPRFRDPERSRRVHQPHGQGRAPGPRSGRKARHGVALLEGHRPRRRRVRRRRAVEIPDPRKAQLPPAVRRRTARRRPFAVRDPRFRSTARICTSRRRTSTTSLATPVGWCRPPKSAASATRSWRAT